MRVLPHAGCAAVFVAVALASPRGVKGKIDYNRDVRPIIAKCLSCHGNDPAAIQAGLKLDNRESATTKLSSGHIAIVPGRPEQSELVKRVFAENPDNRMPPPYSNKTLTEEEKQTLKRWIAEGADYRQHWAFVAPKRPALPKVKSRAWPKNGIDYFVLAKLEQNGLQPSPAADRRTLIRRVSLDLTGLPPTPREVDAFLKDKSANAYERVVDRLLASPRYGERMAMDWMDAARYADSNGYQADYERYQWRWRDWVIDAYNKNMPFDQFTVEQLAGDMLPNATMDQRLATGFNRNHRINTEGGVIADEWRVETVIDRVETTSAVWLGLTAGCARCHDHKYDPLSQREFYSMYAYFNNVPESGTGVEQPVNHPPVMKAPYPEQTRRLKQIDSELRRLDPLIKSRLAQDARQVSDWKLPEPAPAPSLDSGLIARYRLGVAPSLVAGKADVPKVDGQVTGDAGRATGAVRTSAKGFIDLGSVGDFEAGQPHSFALWVYPEMANGTPLSRMDAKNGYRGWDLSVSEGQLATHLINVWPARGAKIATKDKVPLNQWSHVVVNVDGTGKARGLHIYVNGKEQATTIENDTLSGSIRTAVSTKVGRRTGSDEFAGKVDGVAFYDRMLSDAEIRRLADVHPAAPLLAVPKEKRTKQEQSELENLWALEHDPWYKAMYTKRNLLVRERSRVESEITTVMVMEDMEYRNSTRLLIRGQYNKRGPIVPPGVPAIFPPLPKGAPNNRLGLAKWVVDPANPLTARVAVNRMWERIFGIGIVATSEDFGTRAEFPSHPELLDWLATEFVRLKWNQKAMWKELVMSATYRQSSRATAALLKKDPQNRLLARGPRFRLPAEMIRDQALAVSGLLVEKIGGPSVRPYQPDGIWDELNVYGNLRNYMHDKDGGEYRRSLYTIWKRTAAPPDMTLFDVPSRETCRVRRARTNTPLQALALLNDEIYVEAAKGLAQKMILRGGSTAGGRVAFAFRTLLARAPTPEESRILAAGVAKHLAKYRANRDAARKLIAIGDSKPDPRIDVAELAAYTVAASTILNLDEAITKE